MKIDNTPLVLRTPQNNVKKQSIPISLTYNNKDVFQKSPSFKSLHSANMFQFFNVCLSFDKNAPRETQIDFLDKDMEFMEIYSKLDKKEDLAHFSDILLYLYTASENKNYFNPNKLLNVLHKSGLNDMKDFDSKFAHLKEHFNGFETTQDKVDAIEYLEAAYDNKINLIEDSISSLNKNINIPSHQIYSRFTSVIDYLYEQNQGKSLAPLNTIIKPMIEISQTKDKLLKLFSPDFNDLKTPEDNIKFFNFLSKYNISVTDLKNVSGKNILSDIDRLDCLANKDVLIPEITKSVNGKKALAQEHYKKFFALYNSVYNNGKFNPSDFKTLSDIIGNFKIKDDNAMLNLYNKINLTKEKSLTNEQFRSFIKLMAFCDSPNIINQAKLDNTTPIKILLEEERKFNNVENKIKNFVSSDKTNYFIGKSPIEIYNSYKMLINDNPDAIPHILENAIKYDISDSIQYNEKLQKINTLQAFFTDRKSFSEFVSKNNIKFDSSENDEQFLQNCFNVLSLLDDNEKEYFVNSDFLMLSSPLLENFYSQYPDKVSQKEILSLVSKKKIPSLKDFNDFLKAYEDKNGGRENIIQSLKNTPDDIDFTSYKNILETTVQNIKKLNFSAVTIDNENIANIDFEHLKQNLELSKYNAPDVLNNILSASPGENFILKLPSAISTKKLFATPFKIAFEIAVNADKNQESYNNIISKFKLDKKSLQLDKNISEYAYADAIEKALPKEFIDLVNDDSCFQFNDKTPALSLHAKIRMIDRFAFNNSNSSLDFHSDEIKTNLKNIISLIYSQNPYSVKGQDYDKRILTETYTQNNEKIQAVFSKYGMLITVMN